MAKITWEPDVKVEMTGEQFDKLQQAIKFQIEPSISIYHKNVSLFVAEQTLADILNSLISKGLAVKIEDQLPIPIQSN